MTVSQASALGRIPDEKPTLSGVRKEPYTAGGLSVSVTTRACPVCGTKVKLENLRRHVANVHPGQRSSIVLSIEEERTLRGSVRRPHRSLPLKKYAVVAVLAVLVVAGLAFALPRLGGAGPMHIHPHLALMIDGQSATIPENIGIDPSLWHDRSLDEYSSMTDMPSMGMAGMAPLHTHDSSGTIHVESRVTRDYTLGEFFRTWGESFDGGQVLGHATATGHAVWVTVDGSERPPSSSVVLRDGMTIEIVCGAR